MKLRNSFFAIIILFLTSACSSGPELTPQQALSENLKALRDAATQTITDEARRLQFMQSSRRLERVLFDYNSEYARFAQQMRSLNQVYTTPRSEQEALLAAFTETRQSAMQAVVDIHFDMVEVTTADEWQEIVEYESEALKSMRQLPAELLGADS